MTSSVKPYSATRKLSDGVEIICLADKCSDTEVTIVPSIGNIACRMDINDKNIFWFPYKSVSDFKRNPKLCGNPFLAPWANRLDEHAFFSSGKKYLLNRKLNNYETDPNEQPIHGLLLFTSKWEVVNIRANSENASVTSRFEFAQHAGLMAQFPFAHNIEMTYRLANGNLEVVIKMLFALILKFSAIINVQHNFLNRTIPN